MRASQRSQAEKVLPGEKINSAAPAANKRRQANIKGAKGILEFLGKGKVILTQRKILRSGRRDIIAWECEATKANIYVKLRRVAGRIEKASVQIERRPETANC
jgi:hypothetical protein